MRAVVVNQIGGPEALELRNIDPPRPSAGEILVEVAAAGVNFVDLQQRSGGLAAQPPFVAGSEGAGRVAALGRGVHSVAVGDRVAWSRIDGAGYAEFVVIPAGRAIPIPDAISTETAAAVMVQGLTAHYLSESVYLVGRDENALVHAAGGGVGLLLTQMIHRRGGRVIGTCSSGTKAAAAQAAGAAHVVDYARGALAVDIHRLTDGHGVAVVFDGVGRATFCDSLASLRARGTLVLYGAASGAVDPMDPEILRRYGSLYLTWPTLADYTAGRELHERAAEIFSWVAEGRLDVRIAGQYGLEEARRAHVDLASRRVAGKLLLIP